MLRFRLKPKCGSHWGLLRKKIKGSLSTDRVKYNSGDVIEVEDGSELGGALDKFEPLEVGKKDKQKKEVEVPVNKDRHELEKIGQGIGMPPLYNVVNLETKTKVNDNLLTLEEANSLTDDLEGS